VSVVYVDSSALVKLAVEERESTAIRAVLRSRRDLVTSAIARTEVGRAVAAQGADAVKRAAELLDRLELIRVNDRVLRLAASLPPPELRSLDAIHLATAKLVGGVTLIVTHDDRMAAAARAMKWKVAAPR
jgi:predicted nucleic acid-binding protein